MRQTYASVFAFILNAPFTLAGILLALISFSSKVRYDSHNLALVFKVRELWWTKIFHWLRGARATTTGHVVLLSPLADDADLRHELVHVEQWIREPFIHPILYLMQTMLHGYRNNKYEIEAYKTAHNRYINHMGEIEVL